jgi:hypothetical protein
LTAVTEPDLPIGTANFYAINARFALRPLPRLATIHSMAALIQVTAWEKVSLWRRIPCAFVRVAILVAVVVGLINVAGPPITIFFMARKITKTAPRVNVTPQPLADYSVSSAPGTAMSYFGYEFEVPWNASFKRKAFNKTGLVQLQFDDGQNVTFIVPGDQTGLLSEIVHDKSMHMQNLQFVFGDLMNRSAYDQYAAILNTTPSSIRAFGPRAEASRGVTLLLIKSISVASGLESGVFTFEFLDKRGFQVGDPQKSKRVDLEVFDSSGHYVEIICATIKDNIRLTQPELNRILKSFHQVSTESPAPHLSSATASPN